jgi:HEAT repeat protein
MRTRRLMVTASSVVLLAIQTVVSAAEVTAPVLRPMADLLDAFDNEPVFWKQVEVAKQIISRGDKTVLPRLEHWLSDEDRHRRGNAALIFGGLGDPRGLEVIVAILTGLRPEGWGSTC